MTQMLNYAISSYRRTSVALSPLAAVVRLLDEAIRSIRKAVQAIGEKRHEESYVAITKASTILRGLIHNLKFERGEDLCEDLMRTYNRNIVALHTSYGRPDAPQRYQRIIEGLTELRDAWASVAGMKSAAEMVRAPDKPNTAR
ncbi:flagellar protein FliS [Phreatobacter aquaticus]|uniref:Flagellar protein FliS n=1 Tax=Phreatobacter aquaticus TaxID=2570229 RepID=A0A4D7QFX3_9HYPH|nr:flagellar export chaperone FliS [Phreatobacter aquaticus]QCK85581.1 flagellar protein FliS [Phreatobacter aquaticus]